MIGEANGDRKLKIWLVQALRLRRKSKVKKEIRGERNELGLICFYKGELGEIISLPLGVKNRGEKQFDETKVFWTSDGYGQE